MKNKEYEFYVARDKNGAVTMFDIEPILDSDSSEWISANGQFKELDSREYIQVTFENSPMRFTIDYEMDFDDNGTNVVELNVDDIFTYSNGIFRVVALNGSLYYLDDIRFDSDWYVSEYNHSMTDIDIFNTFDDLKRVENKEKAFTQFTMMKIRALKSIEMVKKSVEIVNELYNEYKNIKGENQ